MCIYVMCDTSNAHPRPCDPRPSGSNVWQSAGIWILRRVPLNFLYNYTYSNILLHSETSFG